jgi:hypothetical protein
VSSNVIVIPLAALYSPPRSVLTYTFDAEKNIFTSQHEILATGCIEALPKASNLFRGVASLAAFHFILDVGFCFFRVDVFFGVVDEVPAFDAPCFVSVCAEAVWTEAVEGCKLFFVRALLLRTCVTGASFTGSATASELPGFTSFEER